MLSAWANGKTGVVGGGKATKIASCSLPQFELQISATKLQAHVSLEVNKWRMKSLQQLRGDHWRPVLQTNLIQTLHQWQFLRNQEGAAEEGKDPVPTNLQKKIKNKNCITYKV